MEDTELHKLCSEISADNLPEICIQMEASSNAGAGSTAFPTMAVLAVDPCEATVLPSAVGLRVVHQSITGHRMIVIVKYLLHSQI